MHKVSPRRRKQDAACHFLPSPVDAKSAAATFATTALLGEEGSGFSLELVGYLDSDEGGQGAGVFLEAVLALEQFAGEGGAGAEQDGGTQKGEDLREVLVHGFSSWCSNTDGKSPSHLLGTRTNLLNK